MMDWDRIYSIVQTRRSNDAALIRQMIDIRDRVNGDVVIPIRTAEGEPDLPPLAPQIIHDGIEHTALRAAGPLPNTTVPALDPKQGKSRERARLRQKAIYANWHYNMMNLVLYRIFRHFVGYGTFALAVLPEFETKRACLEIRNPLTTYPEPRSADDMKPPRNVASIFGKSSDFLRRKFGSAEVMELLALHPEHDGLWDLVEWIDEDEIVMGVLGPRNALGEIPNTGPRGLELRRWPNRAGMCTIAAPRRITLDKMAGQLDAVTGMTDWLDRLMALNVVAAEKNVFADAYAIGDEGRTPEIVGGEWKDGRTGEINLLSGVKSVGQLVSTTGPMTQAVVDRIERSARLSSGTISQFGGENPQGLRTGRAIDTLGSYSVDPRIKEAQDVVAANLERRINPAILEVEKGYWPGKKYVCFSGWPSDIGHVEYTPGKDFETSENVVAYAFPGLDLSQISIAVLQLNGGELMSKHTARVKHPMIDSDPDLEKQLLTEEAVEMASRAAFQQQAVAGAIPAIDVARVHELVLEGVPLHKAVIRADEEARERQVKEPAEPGEGQVASPEQAPGLAMPGMGAEGPPGQEAAAQQQGPQPSQQNLRQLLQAVRQR